MYFLLAHEPEWKHREPAVYHKIAAGRVAAQFLGKQERHSMPHLYRVSEPVERDNPLELLLDLIWDIAGHPGLVVPGSDHVHPDAVRRQLDGKVLHQTLQAYLGDAI